MTIRCRICRDYGPSQRTGQSRLQVEGPRIVVTLGRCTTTFTRGCWRQLRDRRDRGSNVSPPGCVGDCYRPGCRWLRSCGGRSSRSGTGRRPSEPGRAHRRGSGCSGIRAYDDRDPNRRLIRSDRLQRRGHCCPDTIRPHQSVGDCRRQPPRVDRCRRG